MNGNLTKINTGMNASAVKNQTKKSIAVERLHVQRKLYVKIADNLMETKILITIVSLMNGNQTKIHTGMNVYVEQQQMKMNTVVAKLLV
jgi:hypothetical protein